MYFRFVDVVWGLWTHGLDALLDFHTEGNQINPRIKLELGYSTEQLEFLDTVTSLRCGRLHTDLYTKPTDKHLYLHMESSHPEATKKAIPYGLGVRVKRICAEEGNYRKHRDAVKDHLVNRGYEGAFVENELTKVDAKDREELLKGQRAEKTFEESAAGNHVLQRSTKHQEHFSQASPDAAHVRPDEGCVSGAAACSVQKRCQPGGHFSAQKAQQNVLPEA